MVAVNPNTEDAQLVPVRRLEQFAFEAFRSIGVPEECARITSQHLVTADCRGVDTHGVIRLPIYIERLERGDVDAAATPEILSKTVGTAVMDARNCLGQFAGSRGMNLTVELAREAGAGVVAIRNSNHFGACADYALMAARSGLIGFATTNTPPLMAPPGGSEKRLGNNPMAFAVPTRDGEPFVLDIAFSVVAMWNLVIAEAEDRAIPDGWGLDREGQPTSSPTEALRHGMLRAVGDHKGAGLAMVMDLLSGVLSGGHYGTQPSSLRAEGPMRVAHTLIAIDPAAFMERAEFLDRVADYVAMMRGAAPASGVEQVMVPGEPERHREVERVIHGIPLQGWLLDQLDELATRRNISPVRDP